MKKALLLAMILASAVAQAEGNDSPSMAVCNAKEVNGGYVLTLDGKQVSAPMTKEQIEQVLRNLISDSKCSNVGPSDDYI